MNREKRRAAERSERRARKGVLATGLAAAAAAAGLSGAAAEAANHRPAAGGRIFACYSDRTHVLSYLKPPATKCGPRSTKISWHRVGPQGRRGARGARGPQGPAGAVVGFAHDVPLTATPVTLPPKSPQIVASFAPTSSAPRNYAVTATANAVITGSTGGPTTVECWLASSHSQASMTGLRQESTTPAVNTMGTSVPGKRTVALTNTGDFSLASDSSTHALTGRIIEVCSNAQGKHTDSIRGSEMTATSLKAPKHAADRPTPKQRFVPR